MEVVGKWPKGCFWHEVLEIWSEWNYNSYPMVKETIINQFIWYNSLLRVGKKPFFYKSWYDKDIKTIQDIIVDNRWITVDELFHRYNIKTNYLELQSVLSSIPKYWKYIIFTESDILFQGYKLDTHSYDCKDTYKELLKNIVYIPEQYVIMWQTLLDTEIDEWDWFNSYPERFSWTISTK